MDGLFTPLLALICPPSLLVSSWPCVMSESFRFWPASESSVLVYDADEDILSLPGRGVGRVEFALGLSLFGGVMMRSLSSSTAQSRCGCCSCDSFTSTTISGAGRSTVLALSFGGPLIQDYSTSLVLTRSRTKKEALIASETSPAIGSRPLSLFSSKFSPSQTAPYMPLPNSTTCIVGAADCLWADSLLGAPIPGREGEIARQYV